MPARNYAIAGAAAAGAFAIFLAMAQSHVILVPYLTPAVIEVHGLDDHYSTGDRATFDVTIKGYGSNCHMLQVEATDQAGDRASYYRKADDCRYMVITHGPYNFTQSLEYGSKVLAKQGTYRLDIQFEDLKDGTKAAITRSVTVQ